MAVSGLVATQYSPQSSAKRITPCPATAEPRFRHPGAARRRRARPGHRRPRDADPPDHLVRVRDRASTPPRCSTWSARATSTAASRIRPTPCSRSASPRSKAASARSPPPAARRRCTWRSPRIAGAGSHIVASSALYGGSHNLLHYTLSRFGIETTLRQARRHRRLARRDPAEDEAAVRRDARQPRPRRARHPDASRRSPTSTTCRCWSTRPSRRPG